MRHHDSMPPIPDSARVPASQLRPGRFWYVIAAVITVVGFCGPLALFGFTLYGTFSGFSPVSASGVEVAMKPGEGKQLFRTEMPTVDVPEESGGPCTVSGPGKPTVTKKSTGETLTVNGTEWHGYATVSVDRPGTYHVSCASIGGEKYAVGETTNLPLFIGSIFVVVLVPMITVLLVTTIVVITAVRRHSHHKRLTTGHTT